MQKAFINKMYDIAGERREIVLLTADNGTDFDILFARAYPGQYYNMGIAEENMVAVAAGMALCGKIPFVCSSGAFLAYRAFEFIRNDICFQNQNVKIIALGSGMSISALGPTHHTTEDFGALRTLPNLRLLSLASPMEVDKAIDYALHYNGPVYLRMGMNAKDEWHKDEAFSLEKINILKEGGDAVIFVTGGVVKAALEAAYALKSSLDVCVAEVISIKPLDEKGILELARHRKYIFSMEDHNVINGLGTGIADVLNQYDCARRVVKLGLNDCFADGFGSQEALLEHNGLGTEALARRIRKEVCGE